MDVVGGTVKDGHVVPDKPLPEGTRVEIRLPAPSPVHSRAEVSGANGTNGHTPANLDDAVNSRGTNGSHPDGDAWSWEQAIAQAPVSDWQRAREAQAEAEARARAEAAAAAEREAKAVVRRRTQRRLGAVAIVLLGALTATLFWYRATEREHHRVKISSRVVKSHSVELTLGAGNGSVESMRALAQELTRSPGATELIVFFGWPRTRLIYDRHAHSLTAIPGKATAVTPCGSFVSGPSFSKVSDHVIQQVAASGGAVSDLSRFCGPPGRVDASNCS